MISYVLRQLHCYHSLRRAQIHQRTWFRHSQEKKKKALSQAIRVKVERAKGGVEAQCLWQRPPSALSQAITVEDERRQGVVEAQCLCLRPPSAFSDDIPF
jgi:hypothetical protein